MDQFATQCFKSECGKARIYVENDMSIGAYHDFLLQNKGMMVDKMVEAQKQEKAMSEAQKNESCAESDCSKGE